MSACVPYWGHVAKNGYGAIARTHRQELAHRVIYEQCTIIGRGGRRTCRACKVANDGKRWGRAA